MKSKLVFIMHDFSIMGGVEKVTSNLIKSFEKYNINVWGIVSYHQLNTTPIIDYPDNITVVVEQNLEKIIDILKENHITQVILQVGNIKSQSSLAKKLKNKKFRVYAIIHSTPYFWIKKFFIHNFFDILRLLKMEIYTKYMNRFYFNRLLNYSDEILFVSKTACQEAKKVFKNFENKINYIYNISYQSKNNISLSKKENIIVYAGRFDRNKRVLHLLKILSPLLFKKQNWKFILLGDGEERLDIEEYLKQVNCPNIYYLGQVDNVDKYLIKSKICVLYSYYEGLPTILLEAVQYKNLIVANNGKGGFADIVQDGRNGFLVKNDTELYEKIELLISNEEVYYKMYHNCIIYQQFSENEIMKKWQQILLSN